MPLYGYDEDPYKLNPADASPDPTGQLELASSDLLAALAKRTAQAQQQAGAANAAYQAAASQPAQTMQQSNPAATSIATGLGRIAEGLGATGAPAQLRQTLDKRNSELAQRRLENLNALGKNYELLAKRAETLGDLESTTKYRSLSDKLAREQTKLIERQRNTDAMSQIHARGEEDRATNAAKPPGSGGLTLDEFKQRELYKHNLDLDTAAKRGQLEDTDTIEASVNDVNRRGAEALKDVPIRLRRAVINEMDKRKLPILPEKVHVAIGEVGQASEVLTQLKELSTRILRAKPGLPRLLQQGKLSWEAFTQENSDAAEYERLRGALSGNLARAVGAERGVLTDQDRKFVLKGLPDFGTTGVVTTGLFDRQQRFLANKAQTAIRNYTVGGDQLIKQYGGGASSAPTPSAVPTPGPDGKVAMLAPDGRPLSVPPERVADMIAKGAKLAPTR